MGDLNKVFETLPFSLAGYRLLIWPMRMEPKLKGVCKAQPFFPVSAYRLEVFIFQKIINIIFPPCYLTASSSFFALWVPKSCFICPSVICKSGDVACPFPFS